MATLITRKYNDFRGIDLRGGECAPYRSPDAMNVWRDYRKQAGICTRPSARYLVGNTLQLGQKVHSISFFQGKMLWHADDRINLYDPKTGENRVLSDGLVTNQPSQAFVYNGKWYFKQAGRYLMYQGGNSLHEAIYYVPTTTIGKKPEGGGTTFEDVNILTTWRKNTFVSDGTSTEYHLDAENIINEWPINVIVNDELVRASEYSVDYEKGTVTFKTAPVAAQNGQDNVSIEFQAGADQRHKILNCTLTQIFDNRVFFSGNPEYPNMIWHSALDDPGYISDLDYYQEGRDEAPVRGMVAGNNALWVFRGPSDENTTVFYHQPVLDNTYGKVYPAVHSSISTGCVGKAINFNDDIVFFSERGMEGISGNVTTEQVLGHRSSLVDRKMATRSTAEDNLYSYKNMVLAEWEGYLMVFFGSQVYLADSRGKFTNGDHMEYEWFWWDLFTDMYNYVSCVAVHENVVYLGNALGEVWTITNKEEDNADVFESYWTTPKEKFQNPNRLKTTNKRGCVAEATGDVKVYAKTEDTDFELIAEHTGVVDYFVSRIKRKKFKDIQLKFYSNTRFSLEEVTLEAFVGGYIKR